MGGAPLIARKRKINGAIPINELTACKNDGYRAI